MRYVWFTIFESPFYNWVNAALIYLSTSTVAVATAFGANEKKKKHMQDKKRVARAPQFVIILVI